MSETFVRYEVSEGFATLTLDSPHNRNAISARLVAQLRQGLADAAADDGVRAVVLTHEGGTFCAGADLSEASAAEGGAAAAAAARTREMTAVLRSILELPKPVIGRIDGHVRAGGMGLVGACDLAVAGPRSTFALTEARLGLAASIISLTVLPRLTSRAASRYFLTGERFGPEVAAAIGLVTVDTDDPRAAVAEILAQLRECSPQGLGESKRLTTMRMLADFDRYGEELAEQSARLFGSPEAVEGVTAFLQKRPPAWSRP
ncbi:enoyl-CoA hydratase family protein [Rhodococcus sp. CSLK01-03]|uniref:Enoyl-CoA hydratase family protein n=1 Tax=Rhodococcus indonesiensis TaxID=3055869 RepID=A0ABT7RWC5_9NOCA|nr:enoyl-CoA hydratase family protein [Rhodococcus indonesiensis]MDM7491291.1 enoyl-CoA hydratase family protein [Rhodococcus indonesiensis]